MKGFRAEDARFYEFENIGVGAVKHNMRRQLEEVESEEYTALKMLKGDDNWEFWTNFQLEITKKLKKKDKISNGN